MRVNSVGFKSMMTRRGKSLFFPTLHPAAGLAPGKCKCSLFSWDLLKELAFLRVREAIHIRCKRRSKFWPWHAEPPFTNTPEVRIHLRTCFWCWSLASTITSLLSSLCPSYRSLWVVSCPLFWPPTVWTQDASCDLMPWWYQAQPQRVWGTFTPKTGSLPFPFTHMVSVLCIFCIFNYSCMVRGRECTWPQGNWKPPLTLSTGQVPNILCCLLGTPDGNPIFQALLLSSLLQAKPRRRWIGGSARTLWGSRTCSSVYQTNWEQGRWRMGPFAIRKCEEEKNWSSHRTDFPQALQARLTLL